MHHFTTLPLSPSKKEDSKAEVALIQFIHAGVWLISLVVIYCTCHSVVISYIGTGHDVQTGLDKTFIAQRQQETGPDYPSPLSLYLPQGCLTSPSTKPPPRV